MKSFSGKTVLITGAAGGLGREYIRQLLMDGAKLVLTDMDEDKIKSSIEEVKMERPDAAGSVKAVLGADISTKEGCTALYQRYKEVAKTPDLVIHNAGIINYGYFHEIPADKWEQLISVNLLGPMRLTHLFLPDMVERGSGHIAFMDSVAGFVATSYAVPYSTSKFGIRGFGMALSGDLKEHGISVTIIYPFYVATDLLKSPGYGNAKVGKLSANLTEPPRRVIRQALSGIKKGKLHVYPGLYSKGAWQLVKLFPMVAKQGRKFSS